MTFFAYLPFWRQLGEKTEVNALAKFSAEAENRGAAWLRLPASTCAKLTAASSTFIFTAYNMKRMSSIFSSKSQQESR